MRWLTTRTKGSVLNPHESIRITSDPDDPPITVLEALKTKHPTLHPPHSSTLIHADDLPEMENVEITNTHIQIIAKRIQGSAGPGGCDASHWQDILCKFGFQSRKLCDSIANLTRLLANSTVPWTQLQALFSNRLIALDKSPGIRPIGIGETLRRIISKSTCLVTKQDATTACGTQQLCAGLKCGIEGAIHTASDLFHTHEGDWGILMVDAKNAFNSINRLSLLWNRRILWPRASMYLFNTHRGWSPLIIRNCAETLYSTVQGDPISMFAYAIATLPLINELENHSHVTQLWYADDSSALGKTTSLLHWFVNLLKLGPRYAISQNHQSVSW